MLDIDAIFNGNGPFGKGTFETDIDGPALLLVSGTAYATEAGMIGFSVAIDGTDLATATVFANEINSHKTLVTAAAQIKITPGQHTYAITPLSNTICDQNDVATISLWAVAAVPPFIWTFAGPIPQYTTFNSDVSGTALVLLQGSAFSDDYERQIGINVILDGNPVLVSQSYVNEINSHHALPLVMGPVAMTSGQHEIGVSTINGDFETDNNDSYTVVVIF